MFTGSLGSAGQIAICPYIGHSFSPARLLASLLRASAP
jgi:hypothetical protein